ncbi:hypothetical protein AAC387_Pa08g0779 [Persea americana]
MPSSPALTPRILLLSTYNPSNFFSHKCPPIPLDQPPIPSQLTLNSITPILPPRPPPKHTPALSLKTTTPKPTPPSLNDLPYDVISVILQKSSVPTIDISNPFSILESCTFADPTLNPSTFARNLQAYLESSTSSDLPPGFEPPIKPSTPLQAEQDSPQEVDRLPTQPSPPSLDPKAPAGQVTTGSLVTTKFSLAPAVANNSTSRIICKPRKGKNLTSPAPSTSPITRRTRGKKSSPKHPRPHPLMLKVLYWNCRGIANNPTQRALENMILKHSPNIIFISEPMTPFSSYISLRWSRLGFDTFHSSAPLSATTNL